MQGNASSICIYGIRILRESYGVTETVAIVPFAEMKMNLNMSLMNELNEEVSTCDQAMKQSKTKWLTSNSCLS